MQSVSLKFLMEKHLNSQVFINCKFGILILMSNMLSTYNTRNVFALSFTFLFTYDNFSNDFIKMNILAF